ncbi:hypothetical protein M4R22_10135 [Acidovorax sp. GBBC 3334]|uniref:hypothetical protein n=1 Tax=Acidovorax sp. GBBC 3334 TaxID=2940496 RepID=UPI002303ED46|nr:hypothetical protein [Acidovorax sp. GBBC 3334]MDA8455122.1 hypothetical protein [Acidovorax sp. GBBC 3334]
MGIISRTGCACLVAVSALAIGFAAAAGTAAAPADRAASAPARTPSPAIDPSFSRPDPRRMPNQVTLRTYLVELERSPQANTFCFVQQRTDSQLPDDKGASVLWMIWHEGASIQKVNVVPRVSVTGPRWIRSRGAMHWHTPRAGSISRQTWFPTTRT